MTSIQFEELLNKHGNSIYGFCFHLTSNTSDAEDLYHDAVLNTFSKLEKLKCGDTNPDIYKSAKNYIIGTAVRMYHSRKRRKSGERSAITEAERDDLFSKARSDENIEKDSEKRELGRLIRSVIAGLPEKLRCVTYMYYFADMKTEEIAKQLRIPQGTVKSRLSRSRELIRKELEEIDYENNR